MSSEDTSQSKRVKRCAVWFDFNKVRFSSQTNDTFRVKASTCSEGVTIWMESVKTKHQWQVTVEKVSDCGPPGIPDDVVYSLLEKALKLTVSDSRTQKDSVIDLISSGEEVHLKLQLVLGGVWRPEFVFALLPVALEKVDLLEARLRDAQDEIELLRAGSAGPVHYLSISSKTACALHQMVIWDGDCPLMSASHFKQSEDKKQVTILKSGVYQVNVRLGGSNHMNGKSLGLQLNGVDIATCSFSDANAHNNTAQLHTIVKFNANDLLRVRCGFHGGSLTTQTNNSFTILLLGN